MVLFQPTFLVRRFFQETVFRNRTFLPALEGSTFAQRGTEAPEKQIDIPVKTSDNLTGKLLDFSDKSIHHVITFFLQSLQGFP